MRYIWHINGILAVVTLGILYFGLDGIPKALITQGDQSRTATNGSDNSNGSMNHGDDDSAMIEAARSFARRFGPPIGRVEVSFEPKDVIAKGALWRIDTSGFLKDGQIATTVAAGNHVITFKKVEGYNTPKPFKITVKREQTVKKIGKYTLIPPPQYGKINITLGPDGLAAKEGKWKVDNGPWQKSGTTVEKILVGNRKITFLGVADYDSPASLTAKVEKDQTLNQTANYKPIDYGSVQANLSPDDAVKLDIKWRVKGIPTWHKSGETEIKVQVGKQTIEFQGLKQWKAPKAMAIEVVKDKLLTTEAVFEWVPLKQGSIIVKISPKDGTNRGTPGCI